MLANDIDKQDPSTSTDPPPIVRCKTCNVPLPDALWKNCERCRRNRTESHNRWKKSVQERTIAKLAASNSQPYLPPSETGIPSTSLSNVKPPPTTFIAGQRSQQPPHSGAFTPSQAPQAGTYTTLPYHQPNNEPPTPSSQPTGSTPRTAPAAAPPRPVHVPEYQWGDKLVDDLTELPPRSNFVGKFSTILDPQVNNSSRLHIFANQLRAKGLPISCGYPIHPSIRIFLIPLT